MALSSKQSINGNSNQQIIAETFNYYNDAAQDNIDQGVIQDIFRYVKENSNNNKLTEKSRPEALLKTEKKINRNFKKTEEKIEILEYCKFASEKIALIDKAFSNLDSQEQNDIHTYILSRYCENKKNGADNLNNFYSLFKHFIPPNKLHNPTYENIAKSFVLFFFQDCTIFEKTKEELVQLKFNM